MADNINVTPGTGAEVATDEIGGVHYQRVKVAHGADGFATDVSAASPLPVTVGSAVVAVSDNSGSLTVDDGGSTLSVDDGNGSLTVDGTVAVSSVSGSVAVTGPLTDAELRASAITVKVTPAAVTITETTAAVTTLSGEALAANSNRVWLWVRNTDAEEDAYLSFGGTAASTKPIHIPPGGSWESPPGLAVTQAVNAVGSGALTLAIGYGVLA